MVKKQNNLLLNHTVLRSGSYTSFVLVFVFQIWGFAILCFKTFEYSRIPPGLSKKKHRFSHVLILLAYNGTTSSDEYNNNYR